MMDEPRTVAVGTVMTPVAVDGMFIPYRDDLKQPAMFQLEPGGRVLVPIFLTIEELVETMRAMRMPFGSVRKIALAREFLLTFAAAAPSSVAFVMDLKVDVAASQFHYVLIEIGDLLSHYTESEPS